MNLLASGQQWLADQLAAHAGVQVAYARNGIPATLRAVPVARSAVTSQPGQLPLWLPGVDRVYSLRHADLIAAGVFPPRAGDTVTEWANGRGRTFRVSVPDAGQDCWEWGDSAGQTVRVLCAENPDPAGG